MNYTIEKVTTLIGARRYGDKDANISFVLTDSRSLCFPEETLFFALKTERNDGQNYIPELYARGVRNFVVEVVPEDWATRYPDSNFLKVVGSLEALQRLAERHRDEYLIPIVGITGSNGKTMVKEWLYQLLNTRTKNGNLLIDKLISDGLIPEDNTYHYFNGKSLATFTSHNAIREVAYVESRVDTDKDSLPDLIKVSIIRPRFDGQIPTVMTASP